MDYVPVYAFMDSASGQAASLQHRDACEMMCCWRNNLGLIWEKLCILAVQTVESFFGKQYYGRWETVSQSSKDIHSSTGQINEQWQMCPIL